MKNSVSRDAWGKVQGGLSYFWNNEDENWKDEKIQPDKMMFPRHKGNLNGEVITYRLEDLK